MKNLANAVTISRMAFAVGMLISPPFSIVFWLCYFCGGLSDILDGPIARRLRQTSAAGARLDSVADMIFAASIGIFVLLHIPLPTWLWLCALAIALLRGVSYGIGFYKFRVFSAPHTYLNKATGALLFAFPLLYTLLGLSAAGAFVCLVAFLAAAEEAVITIISQTLERDRKGLCIQ